MKKLPRVGANIVVFALATLLMVVYTARNVVSFDAVNKPYSLYAMIPTTGGVAKNAEVTYLGVPIGTVTSVERDAKAGAVKVSMSIRNDRKVPASAIANVQRKSAIGEPIIDFRPPPGWSRSGDAAFLREGETVPIDRTTVPLEFSELLRSASALIASIPPESVAILLREASVGLEGNSDDLRALADAGEQLGLTLQAKTDAINRLASNNTALTQLLARKLPTLDKTFADLQLLSTSLRAATADTNRLLDRGAASLSETANLVEGARPALDCSLAVLGQVMDITSRPRDLQELHALLTYGPKAFAAFYDTLDFEADGPWVRVGIVASSTNQPKQFVPPKVASPTKAPATCNVKITSVGSGVDYRPGSAAGGGSLPATGRQAALPTVGVLVAAALVVHRVRRRAARP